MEHLCVYCMYVEKEVGSILASAALHVCCMVNQCVELTHIHSHVEGPLSSSHPSLYVKSGPSLDDSYGSSTSGLPGQSSQLTGMQCSGSVQCPLSPDCEN